MRSHEDIVRLDISVHNVSVMEILQSEQYLSDNQRGSRLLNADTSISDEREEVATRHKFGKNVARTRLVGALG
jgi:hypothetical protein